MFFSKLIFPRSFLGQKFAMLELKTMVLSVLKNFKLIPVTKQEEVVFITDLVLRSKFPVKVKFEPRKFSYWINI